MLSPLLTALLPSLLGCGSAPAVEVPGSPVQDIDIDEKSICGPTTDYIEVEDADAIYQDWAGPVGLSVWTRGTESREDDVDWCSGGLIAPNLFMTAGHCYFRCEQTDVWFGYQLDGGAIDEASVEAYACEELVEMSERGTDFALIRLAGDPGASWGWFELDFRTPAAGEEIAVIGHPGSDRPKKVSLGPVTGTGSTTVSYRADTEGGSSGSPVLDASGRYVAVHTNGGCTGLFPEPGANYGRRVDYIRDNYSVLANYDFFDQSASDVPEADDAFGAAVVTGDFDCDGADDVAVAAPGQDGGAGAVSVRYGSATGLDATSEGWLVSGLAAAGDAFGTALAAGDIDGDGCDELAIGAPGALVGGAAAGAVELAWGSASGLGTPARLDAADFGGAASDGAELGAALALADLDGDGLLELIAGAPGGAGAVGLLPGDATAAAVWWTEDSLGADAAESGDRFGAALAAGDFDGDGLEDLAVGAPGEAPAPPLDGAGRVTVIPGASWAALGGGVTLLVADTPARGAGFGAALAAGDFDGDGTADLAVGAPDAPASLGRRAGMVSVYTGGAGGLGATWERFGFSLGPALDGADFGAALAAGDFDGDGLDDLAAAAPGAAVDGALESGRVLVRYGGEVLSEPVEILQQTQSAALESEHFGAALAAGDVDLDGDDDLVVGLPGQALYGGAGAGAVAVDVAE